MLGFFLLAHYFCLLSLACWGYRKPLPGSAARHEVSSVIVEKFVRPLHMVQTYTKSFQLGNSGQSKLFFPASITENARNGTH